MKAMILAAGYGKRMHPLTLTTAKPLLQVGSKRLIEHHIEHLSQAGVTDIVINISHFAEQIKQVLGNGERYHTRLHYSYEKQPLETAGGIKKALPLLGDDAFIVVNGDVFTDFPLQSLVTKKTSWAHLIMVSNPEHHTQGDFVLLDNGDLVDIDNSSEQHRYTYSGVGLFHPNLFSDIVPDDCLGLGVLLRRYMLERKISGEYYAGFWCDVGTPERLHSLNHDLTKRT